MQQPTVEVPDGVQVVGDPDAEYFARCPTCERAGSAPSGDQPPVIYFTDDRYRAKAETRDHREWHPDHRPIARSRDGERVYG